MLAYPDLRHGRAISSILLFPLRKEKERITSLIQQVKRSEVTGQGDGIMEMETELKGKF